MSRARKSPHAGVAFGGHCWRFSTGCAATKPAKSTREDVKTWEGITFISIREEREDGSKCDKKLKTKQSKREVPLHPEFMRLGFLEFVEVRRCDASSPRLFPELTPGHKGYFSDAFSKWFARFVKDTPRQWMHHQSQIRRAKLPLFIAHIGRVAVQFADRWLGHPKLAAPW